MTDAAVWVSAIAEIVGVVIMGLHLAVLVSTRNTK